VRRPPTTRTAYLAARHITVVYTDNERLDFDRRLAGRGIRRDIAIAVPSFNGVPAFLKGSSMLASMPSRLASHLMRDFASTRIPLAEKAPAIAELPMYMVWHRRFQKDPAHLWLRAQMEQTVAGAGNAAWRGVEGVRNRT
jgi:DNA-binding transcriptional LysR family regulator